jgi:hypothetical protein
MDVPFARRAVCAASHELSRLDFSPGEYDHSINDRANAHFNALSALSASRAIATRRPRRTGAHPNQRKRRHD